MNETSARAKESPQEIPIRFLLRFGILVRETVGLPDADYKFSKSNAQRMFQYLEIAPDEDEARRLLLKDQAGAQSLLCAIVLHAIPLGVPISLPQLAAAKKADSEWGKDGFQSHLVARFFHKAIAALR